MIAHDLMTCLSVPYRLSAESVELGDGRWGHRLSYPELPNCTAEGDVLEDVLAALECRRMETILALLEQGVSPPSPRPPLATCDPLWLARDIGAQARLLEALETADR